MYELFKHRRGVLTFALLYLSQGIPIGIAMDALPTLLRHGGTDLKALAWLPLVGLPWVVKFLWAPWLDNHWSATLGRRRGWILPMQGIVIACLLGLSWMGLGVDTAGWAVGLLTLASLASATQDIATDGMAAEYFTGTMLARINAVQVGGVMVGFFVGGAGGLMLVGYLGQAPAFLALALVPIASLLCAVWLAPEQHAPQPMVAAIAPASLLGFIRRPGAPALLLLALLSAMTAVSGFGLSKIYLNDAGWSLQAIGQLGMAGGAVTIVLGCGGGAWLVRRLGLWPCFMVAIALAGAAALLWYLQAREVLPTAAQWVWAAVLLGAFATGATSVSILTAAMAFAADGQQAGTDMTAVHCTRDLGEMLASSLLVGVTAQVGFTGGFLGGAALAVVGLVVAMGQWRVSRSKVLPRQPV